MSIESDIVRIGEQEKALRFERFDLGAAWSVGQHIHGVAAAAGHILSIDVQINGMQAFFAAMPGARPDFEHWIRRKRNIALRFLRSSYGVGLELAQQKTTLEEKWGLPTADYASHGGSVPILVEGVGCIGAVTVSGLPQRDDHNLVIESLAVHRGLDPQRLRHP
ncbi:heme-degrading domain-containing protein [Affinirhizobium pseudoryzae]|uniref:heme-degrading domain-containing protein n=1 Tax=Allorhizobium pseudoryzae TaxID=379684 RepID=UPI0013EBED63|nr:heme-degrading domain-containing protein [Allorhizobium pseudoryzae]